MTFSQECHKRIASAMTEVFVLNLELTLSTDSKAYVSLSVLPNFEGEKNLFSFFPVN